MMNSADGSSSLSEVARSGVIANILRTAASLVREYVFPTRIGLSVLTKPDLECS